MSAPAQSWVGRGAAEIAAAVRDGEVSARTVVGEHLARVDALDTGLGAFRVRCHDAALAAADAVDAHPRRASLPLAGVPLAVKDNTAVAGQVARSGSATTPGEPAAADHEVVRRLRDAGAVVLGLSSMPELGLFPMNDSAFGIGRNPWHRGHTSGGSSGGSAAAVAAGMVPLAQGNDGLGSLRIPAACCGVVGIKPGTGTVPPPFDEADPWFGLAENGALATTVADAALALAVMAGRPEWTEVAVPEGPLRIAVCLPSRTGAPVHREIRAAVGAAADVLAGAGHDVRPTRPPYPLSLGATVLATWCGCAAENVARLGPDLDRAALEYTTRVHARAGRIARRAGLPRPGARERWRERLRRFFTEVDVLLTPALAQPPPPAVRWGQRGWLRAVTTTARYSPFAAPWNLAGWPAAAVPVGAHAGGLPIGAQLVAPPGGEALLLAVARELEMHRPWPRHAPAPGPAGDREPAR